MDNSSSIYKKVTEYVTDLFEQKHDAGLIFHNLQHTKNVVDKTKEIADNYNVSETEMLILNVAAWFHDTGYLFTNAAEHEEKSAELMKKFMVDNSSDNQLITDIEACILATKAPRNPTNLLQQIICDADTYHFGEKEFKNTNKQVREEHIQKEGPVDKKEWNESSLKMLEAHQFYTTYCQNLLEEQKKSNMKKLQKKLAAETKEKNDKLSIKETNSLTAKGIQTMLRLASENHLKLSEMADHKANILISVNAVIISVVLGVLFRRLQEEPYLTIPAVIFLLTAVVTIVISILATRPKISSGTFNTQDVINKKTNLLFFGNFYKAAFDDYNIAMRKMMNDPDYLYGALIKDIYQLAVVLGQKYKLVRLAYMIFMIGIIASVVAFAIAIFFFSSATTGTPSGSPL
ncbi:MAG: Pycsar system effector family protein [Chitinophagaceae bacterium]